ncbi:MAG: PAS domain-containing sensor histidine kinase [Bacteroidota bacterium]|nr:PAS domain-containing sensor histidine kinase [Bacteroidota bacterium]MDP3145802.1 PAS domain-containing sensor histidine kinase [Bacteroidota bacterium]MDP3558436.1 PAS domain-containing sensor histidine kinase [Bacteroidota bacterium]
MESLKALFEYATEGIIIADRSGTIIRANPSSEKLFGYDCGELTNQKIEVLVPTHLSHNHEKHREGYNKNPHPRSMGKGLNLFGKNKNGQEFPVEISLSHYKTNDELFVIAFIIDVSERKQAEENIKRINAELELKVEERTKILKETLRELEASKDELSVALEREKELNDMKSRFVTMASHEFRTPLSTILSSASLIGKYKSTEEEEKRNKHVVRIKSAVSNMTLILNDFLSAGKLEEGKISVSLVKINIPLYVNECLNELSNFLKVGQEIKYSHAGNEIFVCDKQFLKNIVINLVSNSSKFSSENKEIEINTINTNSELQIIIKDNGMGIPLDEQKSLFERFFRAKNASNIQGTGLGLSIVAKYIEVLNGTIKFESELNKGTIFHINLPLQNEDSISN